MDVRGRVCQTFGENRPRFLKNMSRLTFEYPHEGPCVVHRRAHLPSSLASAGERGWTNVLWSGSAQVAILSASSSRPQPLPPQQVRCARLRARHALKITMHTFCLALPPLASGSGPTQTALKTFVLILQGSGTRARRCARRRCPCLSWCRSSRLCW